MEQTKRQHPIKSIFIYFQIDLSILILGPNQFERRRKNQYLFLSNSIVWPSREKNLIEKKNRYLLRKKLMFIYFLFNAGTQSIGGSNRETKLNRKNNQYLLRGKNNDVLNDVYFFAIQSWDWIKKNQIHKRKRYLLPPKKKIDVCSSNLMLGTN